MRPLPESRKARVLYFGRIESFAPCVFIEHPPTQCLRWVLDKFPTAIILRRKVDRRQLTTMISGVNRAVEPYTQAENPRLSLPGFLDDAQSSLQLFAFKSDLVWGWHSDSPGRTSHPLSQQNATETKEHGAPLTSPTA
ncbi:hypothetical protein E5288_WYG019290 [Bos mutus]|uniref:Uncharacterized protein n=1 Tax=Bos mutus TaxID=72004 RepID=A0A6B0RAK0_9CETA|nr:hypothetical protein [Bos mutus]